MKKLNQQVLEQFIKLTIRGESERATRLMEKYISAKGAFIVNEENYGGDDPMFPARRELQRELEDDMDADRVDGEEGDDTELGNLADQGEGCPGCSDPECADCNEEGGEGDQSAEAVAQMIQDLISSGGLDQDKLAKIVDIIASDDDVEGDGLDPEGEVGDEVPNSGDEEGLDDEELPPEEGETGAVSMDSENPEDAHLKV